jgi:hypothetical protein
MLGKRCSAPRGGGSASACMRYVLGEELGAKVEHEKNWDNKLTADQKTNLSTLFDEARQRADHGANAIWSPAAGGGERPSTVYARGVNSLETAAMDIETFCRTQTRVKQPVQHYIISLNTEETKTVSDEQLIRRAEYVLDRSGWEGHSAIFAVHRDTQNAHVHIAIASVHSQTLRAWEKANDYFKLAYALRETELKFDMVNDHGLAVVRDRGKETERIEFASIETRKAWKRDRQAERLEDMARSFLDDSDGLESVNDRRDRIVYAIREYLTKLEARGETPLRADIHAIAARLTTTLETDSEGKLHARLMERASEGTVIRQEVDSLGDVTERFARWRPTDTVFSISAEQLAPSPFDGTPDGKASSKRDQEAHGTAIRHRTWLSNLGSVDQSEDEVRAVLQADPGRVARDERADGHAVLTAENFDRWCGERLSVDWLEISNSVQLRDTELEILSPDAELPLYTTRAHLVLEQQVLDLATSLAKERDPLFNREALDQAIRAEEKALGIAFSTEQLKVFDLLEYRFGVVQGDAGTGKSTLMAVMRRYCEFIGRDIAGFATSQLAAEGLGQKAGIRSVNTARAQALESARGERMISSNSLAILDEASMLSLESVNATLQRLESQGAGGLFIGDQAQLPNLAAGDTGRLLASVAKDTGRYAEVTQVFRQTGPEVEWMRTAVPEGGRALFIERGHVVFHSDRKAEITAKASDVVEAVKQGLKVLAPGYSRQDCLYANRAIRSELGHEGTGIAYQMERGTREIAQNDRVIFERNAEQAFGVLNGYVGTVRLATRTNIEVELDSGKTVNINPVKYRHLEYAWCVSTHKSQGRGDPLVIATLGKNDDARSAHVALTRCEVGLKVHTRMSEKELLDHLSSGNALRPKDDALFFEEIVRRTGGPNTHWAIAVRSAMEHDLDPLRQEHAAEMRTRTESGGREITHVLERFQKAREEAPNDGALKRIEWQQKRELDEIRKRHELETFVTWAVRGRMAIERTAAQTESKKLVMNMKPREQAQKPPAQAHEAPSAKKGLGR